MEEFDLGEHNNIKIEFIIYIFTMTLIGILCYYLLKNSQQSIAAAVFIGLVIGTLMFWKFRVAIAFIGIVILLVTKTIDLKHAVEFMSLDVILFLMGMMIVIGMLRRSGFFRWLLSKALKYAKFDPYRLFWFIIILSAFMAALVDEVTSILFMTALTLDFCDFFKLKPINLIISVVFATNIGSSWTVLGNPIGILIALRSGLTFEDFLQTAFPVGVISLFTIMLIIQFWMRHELKIFKARIATYSTIEKENFLQDLLRIKDKPLFIGSSLIFISTILLLALHHRLELLF